MEEDQKKRKFVEQHVAHAQAKQSQYMPPAQRVDIDVHEAHALTAWDRLQAERGEHLDATRWYQQVATDDLRKLKKRLGNRTRMTITVPERIRQRLEHVPTGLRSACVTRLLARGWLWENAYAGEEVLENG